MEKYGQTCMYHRSILLAMPSGVEYYIESIYEQESMGEEYTQKIPSFDINQYSSLHTYDAAILLKAVSLIIFFLAFKSGDPKTSLIFISTHTVDIIQDVKLMENFIPFHMTLQETILSLTNVNNVFSSIIVVNYNVDKRDAHLTQLHPSRSLFSLLLHFCPALKIPLVYNSILSQRTMRSYIVDNQKLRVPCYNLPLLTSSRDAYTKVL